MIFSRKNCTHVQLTKTKNNYPIKPCSVWFSFVMAIEDQDGGFQRVLSILSLFIGLILDNVSNVGGPEHQIEL